MAVLAGATLLVTPYLRAYDLILLILPAAVLLRRGPELWKKTAILAAWLVPAILMFMVSPIQVGPIVSVVLMGMLFRASHAIVALPRPDRHGAWRMIPRPNQYGL